MIPLNINIKCIAALSILATIFFTGCATTEKNSDTSAPMSETGKMTPFHGKIMSIDMVRQYITVNAGQGSFMTMIINYKTQYPKGKSISDFKVGEEISGMSMMNESGKMMAASINPSTYIIQ